MYAPAFALDILIAQAADLPYAEAGSIQKTEHSFLLGIPDGFDEVIGGLLRRYVRKIGIKLSGRDLCGIPGLMKDIEREETDLRNSTVDRSI